MTLDRAKLTAIGHADHVICNPVGEEKVDAVLDLLDLPPDARALDAGCGKAEILMRLIERRGAGTAQAAMPGLGQSDSAGKGGRGRRAGDARDEGGSEAEGIRGGSAGQRIHGGSGEQGIRGGSAGQGIRGGSAGQRIRGVGVDLNPRFLEEARRAAATRVPPGSLELIEGDVAAYLDGGKAAPPLSPAHAAPRSSRPPRSPVASAAGGVLSAKSIPAPFDAALCTGSTHAFGGYRQTLRALARAVRPGGQILVGEGYWRKDPDVGYLAALGTTRAEFHDHAGNVAVAVEEGLVPLYSTVSSGDEWDRYEGLYLRAVERYTAEHPEDPDTTALRDHIRRWRDAYLRWGRDTLGFGLYLFRVE